MDTKTTMVLPGPSCFRVYHPANHTLPGLILLLGERSLSRKSGLLLICHNCRKKAHNSAAVVGQWLQRADSGTSTFNTDAYIQNLSNMWQLKTENSEDGVRSCPTRAELHRPLFTLPHLQVRRRLLSWTRRRRRRLLSFLLLLLLQLLPFLPFSLFFQLRLFLLQLLLFLLFFAFLLFGLFITRRGWRRRGGRGRRGAWSALLSLCFHIWETNGRFIVLIYYYSFPCGHISFISTPNLDSCVVVSLTRRRKMMKMRMKRANVCVSSSYRVFSLCLIGCDPSLRKQRQSPQQRSLTITSSRRSECVRF